VIKRQFGYVKVRFRGLMKNTAQLTTLFALSNLWMARKQLMVWASYACNAGSGAEKPDEAARTGLSALSSAESRFRFD
jgi:hypothetical protein